MCWNVEKNASQYDYRGFERNQRKITPWVYLKYGTGNPPGHRGDVSADILRKSVNPNRIHTFCVF
jgi:hypothetical protein